MNVPPQPGPQLFGGVPVISDTLEIFDGSVPRVVMSQISNLNFCDHHPLCARRMNVPPQPGPQLFGGVPVISDTLEIFDGSEARVVMSQISNLNFLPVSQLRIR